MLDPIKKWATSDGRQLGLTTENNAEPYMDNLDGLLIWTPRSDQEIPMNTAVYGGYTLYFASNRAFEHGDVSYCLCQARDFVWGTQLGWDGTAIVEPQHKAKLAFLGRLARLRAAARDYLVCGELLEVLEPTNEVPNLSGTWNTPNGNGPVTLKAVHGALWRGLDGSAGVLLANADTDAHAFSFAIDTKRHGLRSSGESVVRQVGFENQTRISMEDNGKVFCTVDVPARDGLCLVFASASSDSALSEKRPVGRSSGTKKAISTKNGSSIPNRRKALRQTIMQNEFSILTAAWWLPRKIITLAERLMTLAA